MIISVWIVSHKSENGCVFVHVKNIELELFSHVWQRSCGLRITCTAYGMIFGVRTAGFAPCASDMSEGDFRPLVAPCLQAFLQQGEP